jgi:hypothetical protein
MCNLRSPRHILALMLTMGSFSPIGCGSGITPVLASATPGVTATSGVSITPSTATVSVGSAVSLIGSGSGVNSTCEWSSSENSILSVSAGVAMGVAPGIATVKLACAGGTANATVAVATSSGPITITKGGIYSGNWLSNDPQIPAVQVLTDDPVTITNSVVTGRGTLIRAYGTHGGHLTVTNTTGIGLDPNVAGYSRGIFVSVATMATLSVQNCTMRGLDYGIYAVKSTMSELSIKNNVGVDFDDRISDGNGGTQLNKRNLGHFIMLNQIQLQNGGEIAWNQVINTPGVASTEDIINIFQSPAAKDAPLRIHDNYLEGTFATGYTLYYTGLGIQFDGGTNDSAWANAFVTVDNNVVVHVSNGGIAIGAGHDITMTNNRIVSCGQDGAGHWSSVSGGAIGMLNYYETQQFYNNAISGSTGGSVIAPGGVPEIADMGPLDAVAIALHNSQLNNRFDDPCWVNGKVSQAAEAAERNAWRIRVASSGEAIGDSH